MDVDNSSSKIVMWIAVNGIRIPIPITEKANFANNKRRKPIETQTKKLEKLDYYFSSLVPTLVPLLAVLESKGPKLQMQNELTKFICEVFAVELDVELVERFDMRTFAFSSE